jgi:hypothetical protein
MNWSLSVCAAFAFCSASFGVSANTVLLPDAQWDGSLEAFVPGSAALVTQITAPGATTASYSGTGYHVSATAVGSPSPTPSLTAEAQVAASPTPSNVSALSEPELTYSVEIVGPSGEVPLGVRAIGTTNTALGNLDGAIAQVELSFGPIFTAISFSGLPTVGVPTSFSVNNTYQIMTNTTFTVIVSSTAFAQTCPTCEQPTYSGMASAYADPYFYISLDFVNASEYSIVTSRGIGNIIPIPEPSTWAMMLLGFAGLGLAVHRRTRRGTLPVRFNPPKGDLRQKRRPGLVKCPLDVDPWRSISRRMSTTGGIEFATLIPDLFRRGLIGAAAAGCG